MFEVSVSTCRLSPSSASAKNSRSAHPEVLVEAALQLGRLAARAARRASSSSQTSRASRARAHLRVVDVALDLAGRARQLRERAVGEEDRVPRVLPALVLEAGLGVPALVLDVAVAVAVAVARRSSASAARASVSSSRTSVGVARPALVLVEQDEEERRRVGAAVVGRVRPLLERGQLAEPELVEDLARLLVAEVVDLASPAARPSTRSVVAASSGANGSAWKLVIRLSRPKSAMNHGRPAAGSAVAGQRSAGRTGAPPGRRGCARRSARAERQSRQSAAPAPSHSSRLAPCCGRAARRRAPYFAPPSAPAEPSTAVSDVDARRPFAVRRRA